MNEYKKMRVRASGPISVRIMCLTVALGLLLLACGGGGDDQTTVAGDQTTDAPSGEPIKLGMTTALTGPYSEYGVAMDKALTLLINKVNSEGGILGRPVELIMYDDQLVAETAQVNMQRLLEEDKVDFVMAPAGSGPTLAVLPLVLANDKIMMNTIAQTVTITYPEDGNGAPYPNIFSFSLHNNVEAEALGQFLTKNWFNVGLISESTPYGETGADLIQKMVEESGGKVVARETYAQQPQDMTAQLSRIDRAGAEVIGMVGLGADAAVLRQGMSRLDIDVPLVGSMGVGSQPYFDLAGDLVEGTIVTLYKAFTAEPDRPEARELAEAWLDAYGHDAFYGPGEWPAPFFGHTAGTYDAGWVLLQAIEKAGSLETADVIAALESGDTFRGTRGDYSFTPERHHAVTTDQIGLYEIALDGGEVVYKPYDG